MSSQSVPTNASPSASDSDAVRIAASIDNWKRKLLDLSKRNRLLNFRTAKVSTVTMVDEQPAEVFRQLFLLEKAMRFRPSPDAVRKEASLPGPALTVETADEEEDTSFSIDYVPYETSRLDTRHTDDVLQTASTPEALDRSLRRIDEQARTTIEEQGVNTLFLTLGMLQYTEARDSEEVFRAPLVLLPVELDRKSAKSGYTIRAADDDPIVNPALAEYLRRSHGITLPDLPDLADIPTDYDLQRLLTSVLEAIAGRIGWTVKTDIHLGLFAFQKFVMYKDLEMNGQAFGQHRLVRQLVTRAGEAVRSLPDDVRSMELDQDYPPERTFQVVDADSSQLRAVAAAARGYDLVLEGPPGTGKSQTITNLVAQALAGGKSVLFVAEKMAALQVVHSRLVSAGLGEFCLELHSGKANKRLVMKELAEALDASVQRPRVPETSAGRLGAVRRELKEYVEALHTPYGALGISPYRGYGELARVIDASKIRYTGPAEEVAREELGDAVRALHDLAEAAREIGDPAVHPWRDSGRTLYTEATLDEADRLLAELSRRAAETVRIASEVESGFGLPPVRTFADVEAAGAVAAVLSRSPGAPLDVVRSDAWNAPPSPAQEIIRRGRELTRLKKHVFLRFQDSVTEREHAADIAYVEKKSEGLFSWLALLDGRYRAIRRRWLAYRRPEYQGSLLEQAEEMKRVDALLRERSALAGRSAEAAQLFGAVWQGEESSWDALDTYVRWVVEFRSVCVAHGLRERALEAASRARPDVSAVESLRAAASGMQATLAELRAHVQWPDEYLGRESLQGIADRAAAMREGLHLAPRWAAFEQARARVASGRAAEVLGTGMSGEIPFAGLPAAFLRAFYQRWLNSVVERRAPLRAFHTLAHEQRVEEFRRLDEKVLVENRVALVSQLRDSAQARLRIPEVGAGMPFLRREMARQRAHSPLRRTLRNAGATIRAIKPCFMMSPLTVAQLLDGGSPAFDLVIFDEASQLPAEDAVGAVARGGRLVVVGDPKQLPPTNFFSVMGGQTAAPAGPDGEPLFEDAESILEEFMGAGVPMTRLKWHYRSAHESLINFSNVSFYDSDLYTFPSVETDSHTSGLSFEYVPDGVYEGKGLNSVEAKRVADAVVEHAKLHPTLSLGVGTFNLRQQIAIQDELELRRRQDPSIEPFFARKEEGAFFVKNLENIQGDERDVIFLSVTYAKDRDSKLRYNFGPLNGENGWRRLNVLTTRARKRMRVFSSMRGDEINAAQTTSGGARLLREFLLYAEHGRLESVIASTAAETESLFEREVYQELTRRGLKLQPQVGVAGYRIDLGVIDDEFPGRYLCGIECDGAAYHSCETARDRDRLRQQVLEARGWTIHRMWSTDWFKDRQGQIGRMLALVEATRNSAREEAAAEEEARARAEELAAGQAALRATEETASPGPAETPSTVEPVQAELCAEPYRFSDGAGWTTSGDVLTAPPSLLARAIDEVVSVETPIHVAELASRIAARWGVTRVGSRIMQRVETECRTAERAGRLQRRGDFVWLPDLAPLVRSRAGTKIPAERIAPEEYREAVKMVLKVRGSLARKDLTAEVRSLLGFSRTGAKLEEAIGSAIDALLAAGDLGEGSAGLCLRET